MRRLTTLSLFLVWLAAIAVAQSFPTVIDTPLVAKDNLQSKLNVAMAAGDAVAIVDSTTGWAPNMVAYICDAVTAGATRCTGTYEAMLVTAVPNANTLTVTRAYGGTSAVSHASGKTVGNAPTAVYLNTAHNRITAIETALGAPNLANVTGAIGVEHDRITAVEDTLGPNGVRIKTFYNVADYGATGDGATDDSTAVQAAINTAAEFGGTVWFPRGTYKITAQLTIPNTGGNLPIQNPVVLLGSSASWSGYGLTENVPYGGSLLDLRYNGGGGAKILTLGAGKLEISHLTLGDLGADSVPFVYTTNTTLHIHDSAFIGNASKTRGSCDEDAIILGGITIVQDGTLNSPFQGYGTVIERNYFDRIRRAVYLRTWANGVIVKDNSVWTNAGGTAPFESLGNSAAGQGNFGAVISGNLIEMFGYVYGIKLEYSSEFHITGNNMYDPFGGGTLAFVSLGVHTSFNYLLQGFDDESVPFAVDLSAGGNTVMQTHPGGLRVIGTGIPSFAVAANSTIGGPIFRMEDKAGTPQKYDVLVGYLSGVDGPWVLYDRTAGAPRIFVEKTTGNIGLNGIVAFPASSQKVLGIPEGVAPTANPASGFVLYVDPGDHKLKARGTSGTVTILAVP